SQDVLAGRRRSPRCWWGTCHGWGPRNPEANGSAPALRLGQNPKPLGFWVLSRRFLVWTKPVLSGFGGSVPSVPDLGQNPKPLGFWVLSQPCLDCMHGNERLRLLDHTRHRSAD